MPEAETLSPIAEVPPHMAHDQTGPPSSVPPPAVEPPPASTPAASSTTAVTELPGPQGAGQPSADGAGQPGPQGAAAMIEVRGVTVDFGGVRAVNDLSFEVGSGTAVGLIGPNGAGKTTAMRAIGGEVKPTRGSVWLESQDVTGRPPHKLARLGLVRTFQLGGEFARLTAMENLLVAVHGLRGTTIWGALAGKRYWRANESAEVQRARAILSKLDLAAKEDAYAADLSGGQRKLVEIGRALMARPKVLLLDEPMAGVNRSMARRIEDALQALRADGLTLLIVEHELGSIERLCDRVVVMADGALLAEGDMRDLRSHRAVVEAYMGAGR